MAAKTQKAMRDVSHYIANHFTRLRLKWLAFIKMNATEMDTKPVFECLLGVLLRWTSGARFIYSPKPNDYLWKLCNVAFLDANMNVQLEFTRTRCWCHLLKGNSRLRFLILIHFLVPRQTLLRLFMYEALVLPYLDYCSEVWGCLEKPSVTPKIVKQDQKNDNIQRL